MDFKKSVFSLLIVSVILICGCAPQYSVEQAPSTTIQPEEQLVQSKAAFAEFEKELRAISAELLKIVEPNSLKSLSGSIEGRLQAYNDAGEMLNLVGDYKMKISSLKLPEGLPIDEAMALWNLKANFEQAVKRKWIAYSNVREYIDEGEVEGDISDLAVYQENTAVFPSLMEQCLHQLGSLSETIKKLSVEDIAEDTQ